MNFEILLKLIYEGGPFCVGISGGHSSGQSLLAPMMLSYAVPYQEWQDSKEVLYSTLHSLPLRQTFRATFASVAMWSRQRGPYVPWLSGAKRRWTIDKIERSHWFVYEIYTDSWAISTVVKRSLRGWCDVDRVLKKIGVVTLARTVRLYTWQLTLYSGRHCHTQPMFWPNFSLPDRYASPKTSPHAPFVPSSRGNFGGPHPAAINSFGKTLTFYRSDMV